MVDKIIDLFLEEPSREHSGEELSKAAGVSRQAVWKKIEKLRSLGWKIDGTSGRGYRLKLVPSHFEFENIQGILLNPQFWEETYLLPSIDSTNDFLLRKGDEGIRRAYAIADDQTGGRGRMGRKWHSERGKNLNMSFLLPVKTTPGKISSLTLVAGITVARAIEEETGVKCMLKWPNDVYLSGKKVCGILTEVVAEVDVIRYVVIGIGINTNGNVTALPEEVRGRAISLKDYLGKEISRVSLAARIADGIIGNISVFEKRGFSEFKSDWDSLSYLKGKKVSGKWEEGDMVGRVQGIDSTTGALILSCPNGSIKKIFSGDIREVED